MELELYRFANNWFPDVKLTSLEYALLPSTKVSISSLQANLSLKVTAIASPSNPFISAIHIAMIQVPSCSARVMPLGDERYVKAHRLNELRTPKHVCWL